MNILSLLTAWPPFVEDSSASVAKATVIRRVSAAAAQPVVRRETKQAGSVVRR